MWAREMIYPTTAGWERKAHAVLDLTVALLIRRKRRRDDDIATIAQEYEWWLIEQLSLNELE